MSLHRSAIRRRRRSDAIATKSVNRGVKDKERLRRRGRMRETIRAGSLPYSPAVMSWLSRELGKQSARITEQDVKTVLD